MRVECATLGVLRLAIYAGRGEDGVEMGDESVRLCPESRQRGDQVAEGRGLVSWKSEMFLRSSPDLGWQVWGQILERALCHQIRQAQERAVALAAGNYPSSISGPPQAQYICTLVGRHR